MKKALIIILGLLIGGNYAFGQEENDLKNFRFGLRTGGMLTWYKPDDVKKFESGGVSAKGSYGLMMEFRLNKVAVIATGFQVDYDGGKLTMLDSNYYFLSRDSEFVPKSDTADAAFTPVKNYRLNSREYNTTYVTLPFTMKLKTPEIGYFTYYGQFGINSSIRLKSRVDDEVTLKTGLIESGDANQTKLDNTDDMNMFKFALNIGGGMEWNLAGSTSLVFGLNWYNGFSNVLKSESRYVYRTPFNNNDYVKQNARASAICLTVGVLF